MPTVRATALLLLAGLAAAAPAPAAAPRRSIDSSPLLWATVNICDTPAHPNVIGIRASMPGSGFRDERMWVRIRVQYRSHSQSSWVDVPDGGDSGWIGLGSGLYKARQTGETFGFKPPADGLGVRLRGVASFEWRHGGKVVRRATKATTGGHRDAQAADPPRYSAQSCVIR